MPGRVGRRCDTGHVSTAALPKVDGPHRNKALAAARGARSVELRMQGWTNQAIADELGYANRGAVYETVSKALASQQVEAVESMRELETARLDALQCGIWDRTMSGEVAAVQAALRIIVARCRLLGLDSISLIEEPTAPRTVVVPQAH